MSVIGNCKTRGRLASDVVRVGCAGQQVEHEGGIGRGGASGPGRRGRTRRRRGRRRRRDLDREVLAEQGLEHPEKFARPACRAL